MKPLAERVGVVVLTHNRRVEVLETLGRLSRVIAPGAIVVADNASTDGTREALEAAHPSVRVVSLARNIGAAARNAGARQIQASYVAFADDDTWWGEGALERAADVLDAYPRLAALTARVVIEPGGRDDPTIAAMAASPLPNRLGVPGTEILGVMAGACMMRRAPFLAVGGYEPRLFLGREEALLAIDLAMAGWAMAYVPSVVVHHRPSPRRDVIARRRLLLRNRLWCAWLRRTPRHAWRDTLESLREVAGRPALWPAVAAAVAGLPWVLRDRRVAPPHVEAMLERLRSAAAAMRASPPVAP
jgi:GT2 family glycosyltransferase